MCEYIVLPLILCFMLFGFTDCTISYDQRQTGDLNVQIGLKNIQLIALLKGRKEEYVDYDYAYDYSEMTIKPQNGTTPKPLNTTNPQTQNNGTTLLPVVATNDTEPNIVPQSINSSISQDLTLSAPYVNVTTFNDHSTAVNNNATEFTTNTAELVNNTTLLNVNMSTTGSSINVTPDNGEITQINNVVSLNVVGSTTTAKFAADDPTTILPDSLNNMSTPQNVTDNQCRRGFVQNHQGKCEYKVHATTNALRRIVKLAQKIKIGRGYKET